MKRTPYVLGATAAGLVALLSFHNRSGVTGGSAGTGTHGSAAAPSATTSTTAAAAGHHGTTGTTAPPSQSPVTTSPPAAASGTAQGKLETYGYGHLRVRATVTSGKLTDVKVLTLKTAETYSQQIAVQVIPMLRTQALKVQGSKIYGITGATYTSEAYALSLQSALDSLHFH